MFFRLDLYKDITTHSLLSRLMTRFRQDNPVHKDMLAILSGITDIIQGQGGSQSSTEYYLGLIQVLQTVKEESQTVAALSLLTMGIKTVPEAVLRRTFSEAAQLIFDLMQHFSDREEHMAWKHLIFCMSTLLRGQEYASWSASYTQKYFDAILVFAVHSKPKLRKSAQQALASIMRGSSFMVPAPEIAEDKSKAATAQQQPKSSHPMSTKIIKFCSDKFNVENLANMQTVVLHTLGLLQSVIAVIKADDLKVVCEQLLSIMTASNVLIRTNCFQTLHALFSSDRNNLNAVLLGKLITALYDYQPDVMDSGQTLAWLTVLKQGQICLAKLDLLLCSKGLVKFIDIITGQLWSTSIPDVANGCSNAVREMLHDCIEPCTVDAKTAAIHKPFIAKIIDSISRTLSGSPFANNAQPLLVCLKHLFAICGTHYGVHLKEPLSILGSIYDTQSSLRVQIEHVVAAAIESMGPEAVLDAIPITESGGVMSLNRSWILPLLRESIKLSTFEYFTNNILKLAVQCRHKWEKYSKENNVPIAHTYELLCCQLWGLFPGFCRAPKDPQNFKYIAQLLGKVLVDNTELRSPVLDGLLQLCTEPNEQLSSELEKFAKNFMPILLNLYTTKPNTTYEAEQREIILAVIKAYLVISPQAVRDQLFEKALTQLQAEEVGKFLSDGLFDVVRLLAIYQSAEQLTDLFKKYLSVVIRKERKNAFVAKGENSFAKQQKKAYLFFEEILQNENAGCVEFVSQNRLAIKKLLLDTFNVTASPCHNLRLKCLRTVFGTHKKLKIEMDLISRTIPECVLAYGNLEHSKENVADDLLQMIAELYKAENRLSEFIDLLMSGFAGDTVLIANTMLVLKSLLVHFTGDLTVQTLDFVLEQVLQFITAKQRNEVEASVAFVLVYIKVLPVPIVGKSLEKIVKSLSLMVPDTKRYCRIRMGFIYKKLCKKFTPEMIISLVPGNDEGTHKRLKAMKKEMARKKRLRLEAMRNGKTTDDDMDEEGEGMEQKTQTLQEILADSDDSDSDFDETEDQRQSKAKASKRGSNKIQATYIKEDEDTIVDLADIKAIGNVTTSKPNAKTATGLANSKSKDPNRGFKTNDTGRLIIDFKEDGSSDDDDDDEDDEDGKKRKESELKADSSSEDEAVPQKRKRKASDALSMASGRSGQSSKYQAGGRGIHRNTSNASMKSGFSGRSSASTKASEATFGGEFRSKKARGDVKKGQLDPYAYIPLNKSNLNKR